MSIAVSAVVAPSRLLMALTLVMGIGCIAIGIGFGAGIVADTAGTGSLAWPQSFSESVHQFLPQALRLLAAVVCMAAGAYVAARILRRQTHLRIDISGTGQIRVEGVHVKMEVQTPYGPLKLLPQSTLWSHLLVLRLQCESGHIHTLFVLPDTVSQTSFRMLSVACHWIAAHNIRAGSENA